MPKSYTSRELMKMRYLITLEQTEKGFSVQVPDLAIITWGKDIEDAKLAAAEAINTNLQVYRDIGKPLPGYGSALTHLENPDFAGLLFGYVEICETEEKLAA